MKIEDLLNNFEKAPKRDVLGMILGNCGDMGWENGMLISVKAFPRLIDELMKWHEKELVKYRSEILSNIEKVI